jgi:histidine triad (HIT) family protein
MSECKCCTALKEKKNMIYEDEIIIVVVPERPFTKGHIKIIPKIHYKHLQEITEKEFEHMIYAASFTASALFENMEAHGTNILANTGGELKKDGHFHIDVLARKTDDGINFTWQPNRMDEEALKNVQQKIKDKCDLIGFEKKEEEIKKEEHKEKENKKKETKQEKISQVHGSESYLVRQLRRVP